VASGVSAPIAAPVASTSSTARRLITGSAPGSPRQTGQTWLFGRAPSYAVEHEQNIFDAVRSWQCTSTPMTASYRSWAALSGRAAPVVVITAECRIPADRGSRVFRRAPAAED
jgi:hypothetical protein